MIWARYILSYISAAEHVDINHCRCLVYVKYIFLPLMNFLRMRRASILPLPSAYTQLVPLAERIVLSLCSQPPNSSATRVELLDPLSSIPCA